MITTTKKTLYLDPMKIEKIILNEKEFAENIINGGVAFAENVKFNKVLNIMARYYYWICGYRWKKIKSLLIEIMEKQSGIMCGFGEDTFCERVAKNAGKYPLLEIDGVSISKNELDKIAELKNATLERLAFTALCFAKLGHAKNPNNNGWINEKIMQLFKMANISDTIYEQDLKINKLFTAGYIELPKRNDTMNIRVTFMDDDDSECELFISDFRNIGYQYQHYKGDKKVIMCENCGTYFRKTSNAQKYCKTCRNEVTDTNTQKLCVCEDCGKVFTTATKNNKSFRCFECQEKANKIATAERVKKYRESKKAQCNDTK